ncbi:hypothetical protein B0H11DRAFT_1994527 [Mycena galericulata]|nr:hypothetical protein B0H11DRAFT_1994527 [Mycena galericulata]
MDFPEELWSEVFGYIPRDALMHVHLVQRQFRRISRPLLFREFTFYADNWAASHLPASRRPEDAQTHLTMQRLQFWSSSEIAPLIHTVRLYGWRPASVRLDDTFFPELARSFARLTEVRYVFVNVDCGRVVIDSLWLLPNLTRLEIGSQASAIIMDPPPIHPLGISRFKLRTSAPDTAADSWLSVLRRDTLHSLSLDTIHGEGLFAQMQDGDPFPNVTVLSLNLQQMPSFNLDLLTKFPAVEVFSLFRGNWAVENLNPIRSGQLLSVLWTTLREYRGPDELLHMLLPIPSLRRLVLPLRRLDDRLRIFSSLDPPCNNITFLRFEAYDFDSEALRHVCRLFPHLVDLHIHVSIYTTRNFIPDPGAEDYEDTNITRWEADDFFSNLIDNSPLPANMQKLAIRWEFIDDIRRVGFPGVDFHEWREKIVVRHPDMRTIWIDAGRYNELFYFWRWGHSAGVLYNPEKPPDSHFGALEEKVTKLRGELELGYWDEI